MPARQITVTCEYAAISGAPPAPERAAGASRPGMSGMPGRQPLLPDLLKESFRLFVRQRLAAGQAGAPPASPANGR